MNELIIENLTKTYPTRHGLQSVLDNVSFNVCMGEHYGIIGRNGSGKSTLIRILSGMESPSAGSVLREMSVSWPMAFSGSFQGSLTGLDNLRFVSRVYGVAAEKIRDFVEDFAELGRYFREPVKTYSSGMQARLAFALSLAIEFDCFLIDEVITVGDMRFQEKCHKELFEKRNDRAFIMVSHNPAVLKSYCNRGAILDCGRLTPFDSIDEAYESYSQLMRSE